MRFLLPIAVAAAALFLAAPAGASSGRGITQHDRNVIRFFQHHPKLAATPAGQRILWNLLGRVTDQLRSLQSARASHTAPAWWVNGPGACLRKYESTDGLGSSNLYGMLDGWAAAGGTGSAWTASRHEQDYRAYKLYTMYGYSPWTTRYRCGL